MDFTTFVFVIKQTTFVQSNTGLFIKEAFVAFDGTNVAYLEPIESISASNAVILSDLSQFIPFTPRVSLVGSFLQISILTFCINSPSRVPRVFSFRLTLSCHISST